MGKDSIKLEGLDFTGILQTLGMQQATGTLRVDTQDDTHFFIYLDQGRIVGADAFPKRVDERLGNILVIQGHINRDQLMNAIKLQKATKRKLGQVLVRYGFVNQEVVEQALRRQIMRIFFKLYTTPIKKYVFDSAEALDEENRMINPIPVENFLLEIATILDELPMIRKEIPSEDMVFEVSPDFDPSRVEIVGSEEETEKDPYKLTNLEYHLLNLIDGVTPVERLLMLSSADEFQSLKALWKIRKKGFIQPTKEEEEILEALKKAEKREERKWKWVLAGSILVILLSAFGFIVGNFRPFYTYIKDLTSYFLLK